MLIFFFRFKITTVDVGACCSCGKVKIKIQKWASAKIFHLFFSSFATLVHFSYFLVVVKSSSELKRPWTTLLENTYTGVPVMVILDHSSNSSEELQKQKNEPKLQNPKKKKMIFFFSFLAAKLLQVELNPSPNCRHFLVGSFDSSLTNEEREQNRKQVTVRAAFAQCLLLSAIFGD